MKPIPRLARSSAENTEPECVTSATGPVGQRIRLGVADRAQAMADVHEAHAACPAQRHASRARDGGQAVPQRRLASTWRRSSCALPKMTAPGAAGLGGQRQLLLEGCVGNREQRQVGRLGQVGQRRIAACAVELGVPRVDRVEPRPRAALGYLLEHPAAEAGRPGRSSDQRHAARFEHGPDRGLDGRSVSVGRRAVSRRRPETHPVPVLTGRVHHVAG